MEINLASLKSTYSKGVPVLVNLLIEDLERERELSLRTNLNG